MELYSLTLSYMRLVRDFYLIFLRPFT